MSWEGRITLDFAIGQARPGVAITPDSLMLWKSSTKPIVAAAVMQCVERGQLSLDDPVAAHLPAFRAGGKDAITIKHLLTHTGGFRGLPGSPSGGEPFHYPHDPWPAIIDRICDMPLEQGWVPGATAGYHPTTSWFILGELIQRVTGQSLPDYLHAHIFEPLGMSDCFVGVPPELYDTYMAAGRLASLPNTTGGKARPDDTHTREWLTSCSPGSSGIGPMRQLVRFYQMMLGGGALDGQRVLSTESVAAMTHRHRAGLRDRTFTHPMDWGLGFLLEMPDRKGRIPYGYGRHATPLTFGHGGVQSSAAFADPTHDLAVAVAFVGMPGERIHQHRIDELLTELYEALGLV